MHKYLVFCQILIVDDIGPGKTIIQCLFVENQFVQNAKIVVQCIPGRGKLYWNSHFKLENQIPKSPKDNKYFTSLWQSKIKSSCWFAISANVWKSSISFSSSLLCSRRIHIHILALEKRIGCLKESVVIYGESITRLVKCFGMCLNIDVDVKSKTQE